MDLQLFIKWLTQTFLYSIIWILMMALCVYILDKFVSFSIKKEIVEDENVSLWIMLWCLFIAIAIIIAASIV